MKNFFYFFLSFALLCLVSCNNNTAKLAKDCPTFSELPDPTADTASTEWDGITKGLHASFGTTDERYAKSQVPGITQTNSVTLTGWKGERLSAQIILWTNDGAKQIECSISDFNNADNGQTLPSAIAQARFVRYVMTDIFEPGCGYRKPEDFPASLSADMLDNIECMDIDARTSRPVWITVDVPRDAGAGKYTGQITVTSQNNSTHNFTLELVVQNRTLPEFKDWHYHLDLWQHPSAIARVHNLKVWSDEHFEAMIPYMKLLAETGQKVITATLNKDPWNVQTLDPYADMITWTLNENGGWEYDYTVFDRWVQLMMDMGVTKQINCYSLVPWNNEIHYFDKKADSLVNVKADPGTKLFVDLWTPFLKDFVKHLDSKGWTEITNIAMDERAPEMMKAAINLVQSVAPQLGLALSDNHKSYKEYPFIKELSVSWRATVEPADLEYRKANGLNTISYVCCSDKFPNMFTFSDPVEAVYAAWHARAIGLDGFSRWAYNSWVENPLTDSRFRTWPAGDTYMVYPDARSSIRLERTREGVQDVEKARILEWEFMLSSHSDSFGKIDKLKKALDKFKTIESSGLPAAPASEIVNEAKIVLNELSE